MQFKILISKRIFSFSMLKMGFTEGRNEIITKRKHHLQPLSLEREEKSAAPDCLKMQIRNDPAPEIGPAGLLHWRD